MIFRSLYNLEGNYTLGQSIYAGVGIKQQLVLGKGAKISPPLRKRLVEMGFEYVYLNGENIPATVPDEMISVSVLNLALNIIEQCYSQVATVLVKPKNEIYDVRELIESNKRRIEAISVNQLRVLAREIIEDVESAKVKRYSSTIQMPGMFNISAHILRTTLQSLLIARAMKRNRYELEALVFSCLLHDIGKVALGFSLDRPLTSLSRSEEAALRSHPLLGKAILDHIRDVSAAVKMIVLNHHEYLDGSGYPRKERMKTVFANMSKSGPANSHIALTEILCVVNDFNNFAWDKNSGSTDDRLLALNNLRSGKDTRYSSEIISVLEKVIVLFPVASMIKIVNCGDTEFKGKSGIVSKVNPDNPAEFFVQLIPTSNKEQTGKRLSINLNKGDIVERIF